ncbi:uncharacterized protein DUF1080 [Haloactinopolyspora alba]|uniref:Uncharacterized protein DUF1080 n=1 Tax=Haloactinopolyspora alba TaxID=648780 RepID=A0A2P8E598_9ACTN|nr:DUF1080 domain-containing protein [Haloactinopolyspora alba]PSL04648.1 uncharacterized protein DUF1080 [Haloactinopolyspora alba]
MISTRERAVGFATLTAGLLVALTGSAAAEPAPRAAVTDETCAAADARPTVRFLDTDSGVPNSATGGGCTINDLIDDERAWPNHGEFVRHVVDVADSLAESDVISRADAGALRAAAGRSEVGRTTSYVPLFDGTEASFDDWAYAGQGGFDLLPDGTIRSRVGAEGGFGVLWYKPQEFADFSLRLKFRDDAPGDLRANSGVQVRFPELTAPIEGCSDNLAWISVACGHEVQINDSPETAGNDPRKTGSIYGFADLNLAQAQPTPKGTWNDLEVRVVGQHYTVIRNGVVINEFENVPGLPFPGRPDDPGSSGRGLVGHVGLQAHGAPQDVVSFRDVRIRDLS